MQTNVLNYIPVSDQENPNVSVLTDAQKEQVNFFNATANYTAGLVASNLNDNREARQSAINERFRFIVARTSVLLDRLRKAKICNTDQYRHNLYRAINLVSIGITANLNYNFPEDTTAAMDENSIPNLVSLYTYELIQLGGFVEY